MIALSIGHTTYDISVPLESYPIENQKYYLKEKLESTGGSAANMASLLGKWNVETYFSGVVGYDDFGTFIKKEMEKIGIRTQFLETNFDKKTSTSFILNNKGTHSRTIFNIEPEAFYLKKYEYDINPDVIVMDGYEYAASKAAMNKYPNAITVMNASVASKEMLLLAREAKYIVCSLEFAEAVSNMKADFNNPVSLLTIYKRVKERYPNNEIIITLQEHGALYCLNNEVKVMPTIQVAEVDRTAVGDIFRAAFAYSLGRKYDLEKAVRVANIAAGLSTTKIGGSNSIPILSDVINYYEKKFGPIEPTVQPAPEMNNISNTTENNAVSEVVSIQNNMPTENKPMENSVTEPITIPEIQQNQSVNQDGMEMTENNPFANTTQSTMVEQPSEVQMKEKKETEKPNA